MVASWATFTEIVHSVYIVQWKLTICPQVELYASHKEFVEKVVDKLGAHW